MMVHDDVLRNVKREAHLGSLDLLCLFIPLVERDRLLSPVPKLFQLDGIFSEIALGTDKNDGCAGSCIISPLLIWYR